MSTDATAHGTPAGPQQNAADTERYSQLGPTLIADIGKVLVGLGMSQQRDRPEDRWLATGTGSSTGRHGPTISTTTLGPIRSRHRRARHTGSRTTREDSVSVHLDGVINMGSARPYGSTCSGHGRGGRSMENCRQTVIPRASRSLPKAISSRSSESVTRRWSSG